MRITKTFSSSLIDERRGCRKLVGHKVIIGDYPSMTIEQADSIVRGYLKNPEPYVFYQVWDHENHTNYIYYTSKCKNM